MTRAEIILAMRLALSAFVSIVVAALLQVPLSFWAAMPVWAMSQPTRGLVLERGLCRVALHDAVAAVRSQHEVQRAV